MTIGFNKYQFYGKIIMLVIFLPLFGFFIYALPHMNFDDAPIGGIIFLALTWMLLMLLIILSTLQLIFLPKGVEIDDEKKTLTLKFLFTKSLSIKPADLTDYFTIMISTKSSSYEGIMIRNLFGKEYILDDFNLANYKPIKIFLDDTKVEFSGHKKFSFVSYFFKYFSK